MAFMFTTGLLTGLLLGWLLATITQGGTERDKTNADYVRGFNDGREYEDKIGRWEHD